MESILASTEDHLVSNLAFKLPQNSASYVTDKQQATYFPQGGDVYSPQNGQRVIRFSLSSSGYLDLSSLVFVHHGFSKRTHKPLYDVGQRGSLPIYTGSGLNFRNGGGES